MSTGLTSSELKLSTVSDGPFRLVEAVPWLMLAAALRLLSYGGGLPAIPAIILADLALFFAFVLAARRMIEFANGRTELGKLGFHEQLLLARKILLYVVLLLVVAWLATAVIGATELAPYLLFGFDGIAFDQVSIVGMVWSSIVAAIVLLMLVRAGHGGRVMLFDILRELAARSAWLLPAIVAVTALHVALSAGQSSVKGVVYLYWQTSAPYSVKNLVYLAFVLGFASLRLWLTLAVLTFALRESYRRGDFT